MVTRADSTGIRPVASTEATQRVASIADARQQSTDQFPAASLGKLFKAQVLSSLTDGSFMVKLQDAMTVQMNLPTGTQVGDKLELTLIATQPRPTFSMPASATAADTTSTELSQTGKLIGDILRNTQTDGNSPTLVGKAILVASPNASPSQVADALKDTVTYSGLFYESHVSQWASGNRPLTELLREPQAKFSDPKLLAAAAQQASAQTDASEPTLSSPGQLFASTGLQPEQETTSHLVASNALIAETAAHLLSQPASEASLLNTGEAADTQQAATGTNAAPPSPPTPESGTSNTQDAPSSQSMPVTTTSADASVPPASGEALHKETASSVANGNAMTDGTATSIPDSPSARPETVHSETMRMVSLQLDTLENQRLMWRGEVWPGQQMEWEISEDSSSGQGPSGESDRVWQSTLRVELPSLGTVAATIQLYGQHVQVQVRAASEETAALLRTNGDKLASALDAAGSPLDQLSVRQDAAT